MSQRMFFIRCFLACGKQRHERLRCDSDRLQFHGQAIDYDSYAHLKQKEPSGSLYL